MMPVKIFISIVLLMIAVVFCILSLLPKNRRRKWFALTTFVLSVITLVFFVLTGLDYDKKLTTYRDAKSEITQDYHKSINSIDNVKVKFGDYTYDDNDDDYSVSNSRLPITLTNKNEKSVEGTLKFDNSYEKAGHEFDYGISNYIDFNLKAGETKTYYGLEDINDRETAKLLSTLSFSVSREGTYSYFESNEEGTGKDL
ncbi:hypothetical protein [Lactococcus cremoris]|uniref:Uncharacterized protein n=1 Tax=Lactococcus cremoris subsp. tructae TaxID=542833 RepID=A0A2A5SVT7_LACLC|nr:hypothetical protein [Lactococcus cremoris]PCS20005.1 hypothetical protein RU92_GL001523 [Lactococcus cremoris subsp. tructae]